MEIVNATKRVFDEAPFVAMLERVGAFPIPKEMIAVVCAFWLRAGDY